MNKTKMVAGYNSNAYNINQQQQQQQNDDHRQQYQQPPQQNDNDILTLKDQKEVDSILAEELNKLSVKQREIIYEEIHGVDPVIDETPEFVSYQLRCMQHEIEHNIPNKPAYNLALSMSPEYVTNPKFRLLFLRAESFDPIKAAHRMVAFFKGKLRLFGKDTLVRSLYLTDLDEDDRACLESGCFQWLSSRDRSGRMVFVDLQNMVPRTWKRGLNVTKACIYLMMAAVEDDEETQRRGVVGLLYHMNISSKTSFTNSDILYHAEVTKEGSAAMSFLPFRLTCVHMCFANPFINAYSRALLGLCGPNFRARARVHSGSHTECQYSLMTFGLPMNLFPVSVDGGEVKTTFMEKWIAKRQRKESRLKQFIEFPYIDMPGRYDVLVGKGKPFQMHMGNVRLRTLIESHLEEYLQAPRKDKQMVNRKILSIVQQSGGRFLKKVTKMTSTTKNNNSMNGHATTAMMMMIATSTQTKFTTNAAAATGSLVGVGGECDGWWTPVSDTDAIDKIGKLFLSVKATSMGTTPRKSKNRAREPATADCTRSGSSISSCSEDEEGILTAGKKARTTSVMETIGGPRDIATSTNAAASIEERNCFRFCVGSGREFVTM